MEIFIVLLVIHDPKNRSEPHKSRCSEQQHNQKETQQHFYVRN